MSESTTRILAAPPRHFAPAVRTPPCLVQLYPAGPGQGARHTLTGRPLVIGRGDVADVRIHDDSVSRRHACVQGGPRGYHIIDLQSTNGTFVNDGRVGLLDLKDGDTIRVGVGLFRFLAGDNVDAQYNDVLYRLAIIDALTETYTRRYLLEVLGRALNCSSRYRRPLALLMLGPDNFRAVPERCGQLGADLVLRSLADRIKRTIRKEDLIARQGPEEFVVVMPETGRDGALVLAERLRRLAAAGPFQYEEHSFPLTVSLGLAATAGQDWLITSEILDQAASNLAQARQQGCNRIIG